MIKLDTALFDVLFTSVSEFKTDPPGSEEFVSELLNLQPFEGYEPDDLMAQVVWLKKTFFPIAKIDDTRHEAPKVVKGRDY